MEKPRSKATVLSSVDFSALDYTSVVNRGLLCPICHSPFVDPVQIEGCDHSFCRVCLWKSFRTSTATNHVCPTCRSPVASADGIIGVPRFVNHILDELAVKCPNATLGCDLDLMRGQVQDHLRHYCGFTEVTCPSNECKLTVRRYQSSERCLHSSLECQYCSERIMERDLEKHWETTCPKRSSTCPHCNSTIIHRSLTQHILNCDEAVQPCRASTIGCSFTAAAKFTKEHEKSCSLSLVWPSLSVMNERLENHTGTITLIQRQYTLLEDAISSIKSIVSHSGALESSPTVKVSTDPTTSSSSPDEAAFENSSTNAPFDSATHHLLSLYENLRGDIDRASTAVSELDAKFSLMLVNENLRLKEELAHTNAVIGSIRVQLQWLMSARLQIQQRSSVQTDTQSVGSVPRQELPETNTTHAGMQTRRLSDSSRQDTKL